MACIYAAAVWVTATATSQTTCSSSSASSTTARWSSLSNHGDTDDDDDDDDNDDDGAIPSDTHMSSRHCRARRRSVGVVEVVVVYTYACMSSAGKTCRR
jgi:hypothetical protein